MRYRINRTELQQGDIIYAPLSDGKGNMKERPCVVLSHTDDIPDSDLVVVAAISKSLPKPPAATPPDKFVLPHTQSGHPQTKLTVRCVAVASWRRPVRNQTVETKGGYVPQDLMDKIVDKALELHARNENQ